MAFMNSGLMALAIFLAAPVVPAAEAVWPRHSASELSMFVSIQRFRIYADHCSLELPQLKPQFDGRMQDLTSRIEGISKDLLASDTFKGMQDKPVPAVIVAALKDNSDDSRHNFERQDAASVCPKTLQSLAAMDDESLKSGLTEILVSVQNMIQMLEKQDAR